MSKLARLYPSRPIVGQDLSKSKVTVVPNQSMTLVEIIRRFIRQEPLNILDKDAFYVEGRGDLEKMNKQDLTYLHDRAVAAFADIARRKDKLKADADAKAKAEFDAKVEAAVLARSGTIPPVA